MKKILIFLNNFLPVIFISLMLLSCSPQPSKTDKKESNNINTIPKVLSKPASSFQDTLTIRKLSAVIYYPDSLQLEKIRLLTDTNVYKSSIHEFTYQIHNAHLVIEKTWPQIEIIESINYRYIQFIKKDGSKNLIDLDTKNDTYGLFIFNEKKDPVLIDMTNIETEISFYLNDK
jgi:hypothetical protein